MGWIIWCLYAVATLISYPVLFIKGERGKLIQPSTWQFLREAGIRNILNLHAIHAYVYGIWTAKYLKTLKNSIYPRWSEKGRRWLADHYHGKVLTLEQAESIVKLDKDIPLQPIEQIITYPHARQIVLSSPPDIVAYECGCRNASPHGCQPSQVCMVIGKPITDFVLEHNPDKSRRLSQDEALELLRVEHERGHVHTAWFKDVMLDRFYGLCNCCKCCCLGIEFMVKYDIPVVLSSGYVNQVDEDLCTGCSTCVEACPFEAITVEDQTSRINREKCMGCGVCETVCPNNALSLVRDENKGMPLDVKALA